LADALTSSSIRKYATEKKITIAVSLLIFTLTVSNLLYTFQVGGAFIKELASNWGIIIFIMLVATSYATVQYLLSSFVKLIDSNIGTRTVFSSYFNLMYKTLKIIQYATGAIFVLMIFQIVLTSHYYVGLVFAAMAISFTVSIMITVPLSYKFFSWYRLSTNKDIAGTILLFGLTSMLMALWATLIIVNNSGIIFSEKPVESGLHLQPKVITPNIIAQDRTAYMLFQITSIPTELSYVLYWTGTVLLLRNYSKKLGRFKFWLLISLPLALYLIASIFAIEDYKHTNVLFDDLLILSALTAGAGLFSVNFLILARRMKQMHNNPIAYYLTIAAYGTMLFIVSISSPVQLINPIHGLPYPPFGALSWCFTAFGIYLYSIGLYFCAIFIAQDTKLRISVREIAVKESELLDSIGTAQMEQEIQKKVLKIAKEQEETLQRQTGIELHDWEQQQEEQENIQGYMAEVLAEVEKSRKNQEEQ